MKIFLLISVMGLCLISSVAMAQRAVGANAGRSNVCSYSPLQEVIRDARSEEDILKITQNNVDLNAPVRCGGTVLQLAVLRGNPQVVKALLEAGADVKKPVSVEGFPILGAPKEVPILMFAGYFAPRQDIVRLIISADADVMTKDANGESILWYINQNPILRNTDLSDDVRNILLFSNKGGAMVKNVKIEVDADGKTIMKPVIDPRVPVVPQMPKGQMIITKTSKDTVGQMPQGSQVVVPQSAYPAREIVEPDMPIK